MGNLCTNKIDNIKSHKEVKEFNFDEMVFYGIAPEDGVYDGDTFKFITYYNKKLVKFNIRCYGYDSPEMKIPKNIVDKEKREKMKQAGVEAREFLKKEICNKRIKITCLKNDKYGRVLAIISSKSCKNINQKMIEYNHGTPYYGGTKK